MSRFFSNRFANLVPYTPGEQPRDMQYIKLNTNESPFPPSPAVEAAVAEESKKLQLYSDPDCKKLIEALAKTYKVKPSQLIAVTADKLGLSRAHGASFHTHGRL